MTHIRYSRQYLESKTIHFLKVIAEKLGVFPEGDKKFRSTWINAIVEHQSRQIQKIEAIEPQATIEYDQDTFEGLTQPFVVKVSGEEVFRSSSYMSCERHCNWKGYNVVEEITQNNNEDERGSGRMTEAIESMTANIETLFDAEDLEQHLEGLCLYSDFCHQSFIEDIEDPRKPVENRCYAISGMVFLEKNGNAVSREYEVWINGQFEYCVLAHTGVKPGYISWMFWADNYSSIPELVDAIHCHRGSGRKEEFAIL